MILRNTFIITAALCIMTSLSGRSETTNTNTERAALMINAIYDNYGIDGSKLLRENHPSDNRYKASYLANTTDKQPSNPYSYLWPFSGTLSAAVACYETTRNESWLKLIDETVMPGLQRYYDNGRQPAAYSSYISDAPASDRFYDDNIWLALDFVDLYSATGNKKWLDKSSEIWKFIESGRDSKLGDGIYWCEQKKGSKNTCSNAPAAVLALKLYKATGSNEYLTAGTQLYDWTKANLQDPADGLYFDNKSLDGKVQKHKFAYNSGQMLQAAALLYDITRKPEYLAEAQRLSKACYDHFFSVNDKNPIGPEKFINKGDIWFTAIMMRGFMELYRIDGNDEYVNAFIQNLDYAWRNLRDGYTGLMNSDWRGLDIDSRKWLLTQAAFAEMFARAGSVKTGQSK